MTNIIIVNTEKIDFKEQFGPGDFFTDRESKTHLIAIISSKVCTSIIDLIENRPIMDFTGRVSFSLHKLRNYTEVEDLIPVRELNIEFKI